MDKKELNKIIKQHPDIRGFRMIRLVLNGKSGLT